MTEIATFGGGCFWGVEEFVRNMDGVTATRVGYMGGHTDSPTYKQVCTGTTGHVEVCQVEFDPAALSYEALLEAFFELHDPTQVNRQGADIGWQYRSVVFVHDQAQEKAAAQAVAALDASGRYTRPVATAVEPAASFWPAEDYHQGYLARGGSCAVSQ